MISCRYIQFDESMQFEIGRSYYSYDWCRLIYYKQSVYLQVIFDSVYFDWTQNLSSVNMIWYENNFGTTKISMVDINKYFDKKTPIAGKNSILAVKTNNFGLNLMEWNEEPLHSGLILRVYVHYICECGRHCSHWLTRSWNGFIFNGYPCLLFKLCFVWNFL